MVQESVVQELLSKGEVQIANYIANRKRTGSEFNLFRILKRHTDEELGHSIFIAELLSPTGSHGQGAAFLNLFLSSLEVEHLVSEISSWKVDVEVGREVDGRIDILLNGYAESGKRFGIAIENKIFAGDQPQQLSRYWEYLRGQFAGNSGDGGRENYLLYYLTLEGNEPSKQSVGDIPPEELSFVEGSPLDVPVRLISYRYHIAEWLRLCIQYAATLPYVREGISQYLETINALTGNGVYMRDILSRMLDSPEKLYVASKFAATIDDFKKETVCQIWDMIQAEWDKRSDATDGLLRGHLEPNGVLGKTSDLRKKLKDRSKERFAKTRNVPRYFGVVSRAYLYKDVSVGVEIRFDNCFYIGLYGVENGCVFELPIAEEFYKKFPLPPGCHKGAINKKSAKERVLIQTPYNFERDDLTLFGLVSHQEKQLLVSLILDIAETMIKTMKPLGLNIKP